MTATSLAARSSDCCPSRSTAPPSSVPSTACREQVWGLLGFQVSVGLRQQKRRVRQQRTRQWMCVWLLKSGLLNAVAVLYCGT